MLLTNKQNAGWHWCMANPAEVSIISFFVSCEDNYGFIN